MIGGGSVIVSPLGKILAGPLRGSEGILSAELDLDDIVRGKFDMDVCGHYSRDDSECRKPSISGTPSLTLAHFSIRTESQYS